MSLNVARRVPAQRAYLVRPIIRHRIPGADDGVLAVPEVSSLRHQMCSERPVASTSSPAPSAYPDVIHSASNDPTVCEAVALSRVAKGTAVDAALSFRNWRLEEKYAKKGNLRLTHYLFTSPPPPPV